MSARADTPSDQFAVPPADRDMIPAPVRAIIPYFLLGLAVLAAYGNCFNNQFVFDDQLLIERNLYIKDSRLWELILSPTNAGANSPGGFFRPVQMLLYWVLYHTAGVAPVAYVGLNIGLHAANACLLYRLGLRLGFGAIGVFFAALLWAVHPIHTEAITYISGTADPLALFFMLGGLLVLLPTVSARRVALAFPLVMLALASKESATAFPLLAAVSLLGFAPSIKDKIRLGGRTWPLWLLAGLYALWRITADGFFGAREIATLSSMPEYSYLPIYLNHFWVRFATFFATLPFYARLLVWPEALYIERDFLIYPNFFVVPVLKGVFVALAAASVALYGLRAPRLWPLSFACLWFFAAHSPNSGLAMPLNALFLEHWMYTPTAGLFIGLGGQAERLLRGRIVAGRVAAALVMVCVVLLAARTLDQNRVWRTAETLFTHIVRHNDHSSRAHANLGNTYFEHHDYARALAAYQRSIEIFDGDAVVRHNMAIAYLTMPGGNEDQAIACDRRAIEINPSFAYPYLLLHDVYAKRGETALAEEMERKGVSLLRGGR